MSREIKKNLDECETFNEMTTIGQDKNGYVYMICKKERKAPHFHVLKDNKTIECIRIDKPSYYSHNGRCNYTLNYQERKELISFFNKPHFLNRKNNLMTNWEFLLSQNNIENNADINEDLVMPDYKQLKHKKWLVYLNEIVRITFTNDDHEFYVYIDDFGNIPHFHYKKKDSIKDYTCICLKEAKYFYHEDKQRTLNKRERKDLVDFFNSKTLKSQRYDTNWNLLKDTWNINNSSIQVNPNLPMPNYLELKKKDVIK